MVALDPMVGVPVGAMPGRQQQVLQHTAGYTGAWSVMTSAGATLVVPIARSKKPWAALVSRHEETSTSMTCSNWSMAR
jgi:hypothetical protein